MSKTHEHVIWRFIKDHGGRATKQQIFKALGDDEESKKTIDKKLRTMETMGIVVIEGNEVRIK